MEYLRFEEEAGVLLQREALFPGALTVTKIPHAPDFSLVLYKAAGRDLRPLDLDRLERQASDADLLLLDVPEPCEEMQSQVLQRMGATIQVIGFRWNSSPAPLYRIRLGSAVDRWMYASVFSAVASSPNGRVDQASLISAIGSAHTEKQDLLAKRDGVKVH